MLLEIVTVIEEVKYYEDVASEYKKRAHFF